MLALLFIYKSAKNIKKYRTVFAFLSVFLLLIELRFYDAFDLM